MMSNLLTYHRASDDSDYSNSAEEDYDSDNSLVSFATPNLHPRQPALKSLVVSLPIKSFPPNLTSSLQSCSICMEDFEIKPNPSVTLNEFPCGHYFHKDCIVEWLHRSNTFPIWRDKFPVDPCPEQVTGPWDVEYDAVLVVDFAPIREPVVLRSSVNVEEGLISSCGTSGSQRQNLSVSDEDGDVMMIDA